MPSSPAITPLSPSSSTWPGDGRPVAMLYSPVSPLTTAENSQAQISESPSIPEDTPTILKSSIKAQTELEEPVFGSPSEFALFAQATACLSFSEPGPLLSSASRSRFSPPLPVPSISHTTPLQTPILGLPGTSYEEFKNAGDKPPNYATSQAAACEEKRMEAKSRAKELEQGWLRKREERIKRTCRDNLRNNDVGRALPSSTHSVIRTTCSESRPQVHCQDDEGSL